MDASSRRPSEMARSWRGLCPAVDCSGMMMMNDDLVQQTVNSIAQEAVGSILTQYSQQHATHLELNISANALEIRAVQSPKCIV
jgi:hypothetical protein